MQQLRNFLTRGRAIQREVANGERRGGHKPSCSQTSHASPPAGFPCHIARNMTNDNVDVLNTALTMTSSLDIVAYNILLYYATNISNSTLEVDAKRCRLRSQLPGESITKFNLPTFVRRSTMRTSFSENRLLTPRFNALRRIAVHDIA